MSVANDGTFGYTGNQTGSKQDAGIKVSQFGYDTRSAPDVGLLFNSSWPNQQIVAYFDHTITSEDIIGSEDAAYSGRLKSLTFRHDLGTVYHAEAFFVHINDTVSAPLPVKITKKTVSLYTKDSNLGSEAWKDFSIGDRIIVLVYNIDIEKNFEYDFNFGVGGLGIGAYDKNVGIKVPSKGKIKESSNLRDFLLHSRASSPMVMYIGTNDEYTRPSPTYYVQGVEQIYQMERIQSGSLSWRADDGGIYRSVGYELLPELTSSGDVEYAPMTPINTMLRRQSLPPTGLIYPSSSKVEITSFWNHDTFQKDKPPAGYTITNSIIVMRAPIDATLPKKVEV